MTRPERLYIAAVLTCAVVLCCLECSAEAQPARVVVESDGRGLARGYINGDAAAEPETKLDRLGSQATAKAPSRFRVEARQALARLCPGRVSLAPAFDRAAMRWGVPATLLVAMARNESTCNPDAVSKSGKDIGLMQIRLGTDAARGHSAEELKNPRLSTMLAARHLARKLRLCEDIPAALGVYAGWETCSQGRASGYARRVIGFWNQTKGERRS